MEDVAGDACRDDIGIVGCAGGYKRLGLLDAGLDQNLPVKPNAFYDPPFKGLGRCATPALAS